MPHSKPASWIARISDDARAPMSGPGSSTPYISCLMP
jgi:hypothetical protein